LGYLPNGRTAAARDKKGDHWMCFESYESNWSRFGKSSSDEHALSRLLKDKLFSYTFFKGGRLEIPSLSFLCIFIPKKNSNYRIDQNYYFKTKKKPEIAMEQELIPAEYKIVQGLRTIDGGESSPSISQVISQRG
jgi:hypothetical protein